MQEDLGGAAPADAADAATYHQKVSDALTAHQAALQPVGELLVRMEQAPALMTDGEWKASMDGALRALDDAGASLAGFTAPSEAIPTPAVYSLRRVQKLLRQVGGETRALAGEWQRAVDAGDTEAVQGPRARLHRIARDRHKAMREMARASRDLPAAAR
ncbi:MAG: hypothetical protein ACRDI2_19510 [Chloroflexota bacterium]